MKRIRLLAITLSSFLLCSCVSVPENISTKSETQTEVSAKSDNIVEMISLKELAENKTSMVAETISGDYDNMIFPTVPDFIVPNQIGEYNIVCIDNFQSKSNQLFREYVPQEILDTCTIIDDTSTYPYGPYILDNENDFYCAVGCTGFFNLNRMHSVINCIPYDLTADRTLYIEATAPTECDGFNVSPEKLKDTADSFAENFVRLIGSKAEYSSEYISSYDIPNSGKFYYVNLRSCYNGLSIFDIPTSNEDVGIDIAFPFGASTVLDSEGNVQSFTVQNTFESYGDGKTIEKIVSPQSAAWAISQKLSSFLEYEVIGMKIAYIPTYAKNIESVPNGGQTQHEKNQWASICSYDVFKLTPYWIFIFDITPEDEIIGLVNCIDGSTEFINNQQ